MSDVIKKASSFVRETLARISGDNAQVIAERNERKGRSALQSQIASLEAKVVDDESAVEEAEERLNEKLYPTTQIDNNQSYVAGIKAAYDVLEQKKQNLEDTKASIEFFKNIMKEKF